jgi:hypothetical protein
MVLGAIDLKMYLDHPKREHPTFDDDTLQIGHVLPRTWRPYCRWRQMMRHSARCWSRSASGQNRIGNLTLVTGPLNIPMSNGPRTDKQSALAEHSTFA